jgi:hypothetical protein
LKFRAHKTREIAIATATAEEDGVGQGPRIVTVVAMTDTLTLHNHLEIEITGVDAMIIDQVVRHLLEVFGEGGLLIIMMVDGEVARRQAEEDMLNSVANLKMTCHCLTDHPRMFQKYKSLSSMT